MFVLECLPEEYATKIQGRHHDTARYQMGKENVFRVTIVKHICHHKLQHFGKEHVTFWGTSEFTIGSAFDKISKPALKLNVWMWWKQQLPRYFGWRSLKSVGETNNMIKLVPRHVCSIIKASKETRGRQNKHPKKGGSEID